MARIGHLSIILSAASFLASAQPTPAPEPSAETRRPSHYTLGSDDQIKIWALGVEEISDKPMRIGPGGDLDLPLIGKVHALGLTVEELKTELIQRYSKELLKPQVSIEIVDFGSQPVSVMGAVNHPGVHQLRGGKTLMEVVSMAGGLKSDAGPRISISRRMHYGPIPLPTARTDATGKFSVADVSVKDLLAGKSPAENILVSPHDVITVPLAEAVYVMGERRVADRMGRELHDYQLRRRIDVDVLAVQSLRFKAAIRIMRDPPVVMI